MEVEYNFQIGDLVRHKVGGPLMVVVDQYNRKRVYCSFLRNKKLFELGGDTTFELDDFDYRELKKANKK